MLLVSLLGRHSSRNAPSNLAYYASRSQTRSFQTQAKQAADRFRILFMGRDEFSCLVLKELFQAKDVWSELIVATQTDVHVDRRGSILSVSPLKSLAEGLGIPVHMIPKVKKEFRNWELPKPFTQPTDIDNPPPADHLLVTASFGRILTGEMLSQFQPSHRLNVHPSLLPAYRGPAPLQHAIMNQEKETGVCVIEMLKKSEGIDAGSVWGSRKIDLPTDVTYASLRDQLGPLGGRLLVSVLRDLLSGKAVPQEQASATDSPKAPSITAQDAFVDFQSMSAAQIYSRFCALSHQNPVFTYLRGKPLQLLELKVVDGSLMPSDLLPTDSGWVTYVKRKGTLIVHCANDSFLRVKIVRLEGRADWKAHAFWNTTLQGAPGRRWTRQIFLGELPSS